MTLFMDDNTLYEWEAASSVRRLYGRPIVPASLIPNARVMTLRNVQGEELILHGEPHGSEIHFYHLVGTGGRRCIGRWVAIDQDEVTAREIEKMAKGLPNTLLRSHHRFQAHIESESPLPGRAAK